MDTMTLSKRELPELEFPLDYPACLDRIVKAAENRADYEINISYLERLFNEPFQMSNYQQNKMCVCECGETVEFTEMECCTECDDLYCNNHFNLCEWDETICNGCVANN